MFIDIILDAEDDEIEAFLEHFVERRTLSRKRGFATINLTIAPFSDKELERIINSRIMDLIVSRYPDLDFGVETKPARSSESVGSYSLNELVEAFGKDLDSLFLALKYSTYRGGKLTFRRDLAEECIRKALLNPEKWYMRLIELLDKHYEKVVDVTTKSIMSGLIPLYELSKLTYLFAYSGVGFVKNVAQKALNELVEYANKLSDLKSVLPITLAYKFHLRTGNKEFQVDIDIEILMKELEKEGKLLDVLSYIFFSQLIFGDKRSALDFLEYLKINLNNLLAKLIEKKKMEPPHAALFSMICLIFGCEMLKEFLGEELVLLEKFDYWGCSNKIPENIALLTDLGTINPRVFRGIIEKKHRGLVYRFLKNHIDWSMIMKETKFGIKDYMALVKETLEKSRDQIIVEIIQIKEKDLILDEITKCIDHSDTGNREIIKIIDRALLDDASAKEVLKYILNQEWDHHQKQDKTLANLLIKYKDKLGVETKINILKKAAKEKEIRDTWMYFMSQLIYEFAKDIDVLEILKTSLGNKKIQDIFFKTIEETINYTKTEGIELTLIPDENTITVKLVVINEEVFTKIQFFDAKEVYVKINITKKDLTQKLPWLREKILRSLYTEIKNTINNLETNIKSLESGAKFFIAAPPKVNNFSKISMGIKTPIRIVKCQPHCEEKISDKLEVENIVYESAEIEESIKALKHSLDMIKKYGI